MTETELLHLALAHVDRFKRFAAHLCGDPDAAEDLVQEAFLRALACRGQLRDPGRVLPWFLRIVRSRFLETQRTKDRRLQLIQDDGPSLESPAGNLEAELLDGVFSDEVARALAALPEEGRACLLLCDVEELTYEDIAEIVECPIGTVRSRIARARARLLNSLASYAAERGIGRGGRR